MTGILFAGLWAIFWKYAAALIAFAAVMVAAWAFPALRKWFLLAALLLGTHTLAYTFGEKDGKARVHAQWDAARNAAIEQGENARSDAERDVGDKPAAPGVLDDDRYNRDRP